MSDYRIQIVFADGTKARVHPGSKGEEGALIRACVDRILPVVVPELVTRIIAGGVGLGRTEARVTAVLQREIPVGLAAAIEAGIHGVFRDLKAGVSP